jgi:hypothetical protein
MRRKAEIRFLAGLMSFSLLGTSLTPSAYGLPLFHEDNRLEPHQVESSEIQALADSTVAIFLTQGALQEDQEGYFFDTTGYGEGTEMWGSTPLCKGERFYEQPVVADCSGALVGPDLVLTAAHCFETAADCANGKIVFGYQVDKNGKVNQTLPRREVYHCKEIVAQEFSDENNADWLVLRLDRRVIGHTPLKINRGESVEPGTPLFLIGHPLGLPKKISDSAIVVDAEDPVTFESTLDTFGGSSGAPVFNGQTGLIEGVHNTGDSRSKTVVQDEDGNDCFKPKVCNPEDGCGFAGATRVSQAAFSIPEL